MALPLQQVSAGFDVVIEGISNVQRLRITTQHISTGEPHADDVATTASGFFCNGKTVTRVVLSGLYV